MCGLQVFVEFNWEIAGFFNGHICPRNNLLSTIAYDAIKRLLVFMGSSVSFHSVQRGFPKFETPLANLTSEFFVPLLFKFFYWFPVIHLAVLHFDVEIDAVLGV